MSQSAIELNASPMVGTRSGRHRRYCTHNELHLAAAIKIGASLLATRNFSPS
jgi:hypothetical protein